mgnify:CR=1 FL=1
MLYMRYSLYPLLLQIPKCMYVYRPEYRHSMVQIIPNYSLFDCNRDEDLFRYNTVYRRKFKNDVYMKNMVDNHHIIPKQFKNHPLIRSLDVDVGCSKNILFMRNRYSKEYFNDDSYIYHESHNKYNKFVDHELQIMSSIEDKEVKKYQFTLFFMYLQQGLVENDPYIKSLF